MISRRVFVSGILIFVPKYGRWFKETPQKPYADLWCVDDTGTNALFEVISMRPLELRIIARINYSEWCGLIGTEK